HAAGIVLPFVLHRHLSRGVPARRVAVSAAGAQRDRHGLMTTRTLAPFVCILLLALSARAQEPSSPQTVTAAQLQAAIDKLGDLDYATRTDAARVVRRTAASQAVTALLRAVGEHTDGYV